MTWERVSGLSLVAAGCVGFLTVADDLDHTGELFSVGGILCAGLVLLADGSTFFRMRGVRFYWVAIGIGAGEIIGAVAGVVPMGVGGGAALGALGSMLMAFKRAAALPDDGRQQ